MTVFRVLAVGVAMAICAIGALAQAPVPVRLAGSADAGWRLERAGKPLWVRGVGGSARLAELAAMGGNAIRTWDAEGTGALMDEARKRGLVVVQGIWLGQIRQGFNYSDAGQLAGQEARVKRLVEQFKGHPALLAWSLGNEVEDPEGANEAMWKGINDLAVMVKKLDPNHPVMTVVAEVGGKKIANLHRLCPALDIVGINSYAGGPSVGKRYREAGGSKPYLITEFGPHGTWEVSKTSWGAPIEATSTAKASGYRATQEACEADRKLCLGSFAFAWDAKQEVTATWFGMHLKSGERTAACDVMQAMWSGNPPANRCPTIASLEPAAPIETTPGASLKFALAASDPDGDPITVKWYVVPEADQYGSGGDVEPEIAGVPGAVVRSSATGAEVKAPGDGGGYRVFAYVLDGKGGAATANTCFFVKGPRQSTAATRAVLPLVVYDENEATTPWSPSGWMGNQGAIKVDPKCGDRPFSGKVCMKVDYTASGDWAGIAWLDPPQDWGARAGGRNLAGAKRLALRARGAKGGEVVTFGLGLIEPNRRYFDTCGKIARDVTLTTEWQEVSLDLAGKDLSRIKTGLFWTAAARGAPFTFYIDAVRYE